jgi:hypothetical protein
VVNKQRAILSQSSEGFIENDNLNLFFCATDELTDLIIRSYLSREPGVQIEALPYIMESNDLNYKITANRCHSIFHFLNYLFDQGKIANPQLFEAGINDICVELLFESYNKSQIVNLQHKEDLSRFDWIRNASRATENLKSRGVLSVSQYEALINRIYPEQFLFHNHRAELLGINNAFRPTKIDEPPKSKYDRLLLQLKTDGLIPAKWQKEFELYLTVKRMFPQAVFQYRAPWLGLQSLDIYIPSKKIAIEYQGEQHYHPVDIFGGGQGYKETVARDKIKLEKCQNNDIKVIYWKYSTPINADNLRTALGDIN